MCSVILEAVDQLTDTAADLQRARRRSRVSSKRATIARSFMTRFACSGVHARGASREMEASTLTAG